MNLYYALHPIAFGWGSAAYDDVEGNGGNLARTRGTSCRLTTAPMAVELDGAVKVYA